MKSNPACKTCGEETEVRTNSHGAHYIVCANPKCAKFRPKAAPGDSEQKSKQEKKTDDAGERQKPTGSGWRAGFFR
jgi:ribosome-binding protein aMBF1 (putative translation factor)